jgi:hypothetical protein
MREAIVCRTFTGPFGTTYERITTEPMSDYAMDYALRLLVSGEPIRGEVIKAIVVGDPR